MITRIVYRRLYNLGNYENETFEVEVDVSSDGSPDAVEAAWAEAFAEVETARDQAIARRTEREQRMRQEYEASKARNRNSRDEVPF